MLTAVAATALAAGCSAAATAGTTSTAPTVTQAKVTGYKSGSPAFQSSGPVTVVLRGKTAAHLDQVLNSLPKGGTMECMENVLLYNITFALSNSHKTIDVAGYACVAANAERRKWSSCSVCARKPRTAVSKRCGRSMKPNDSARN